MHPESFLPLISCPPVACNGVQILSFCKCLGGIDASIQNEILLTKDGASTPGIEPGIFRSVGGRLIHWAMRNEAQEDFGGLDVELLEITHYVGLLDVSVRPCALSILLHALAEAEAWR